MSSLSFVILILDVWLFTVYTAWFLPHFSCICFHNHNTNYHGYSGNHHYGYIYSLSIYKQPSSFSNFGSFLTDGISCHIRAINSIISNFLLDHHFSSRSMASMASFPFFTPAPTLPVVWALGILMACPPPNFHLVALFSGEKSAKALVDIYVKA